MSATRAQRRARERRARVVRSLIIYSAPLAAAGLFAYTYSTSPDPTALPPNPAPEPVVTETSEPPPSVLPEPEVPVEAPSAEPAPSALPNEPALNRDVNTGQGYSFITTEENGDPVRWCAGSTVTIVQRNANSPVGSDDMVREVLADLSSHVGVNFVFTSSTDEDPGNRNYDDGVNPLPVLLAWTDEEEYPELAGDVIGTATPVAYSWSDGSTRYESGEVVIDSDALTEANNELKAVLLHEFAHLAGLGHTESQQSVMWAGGETADPGYTYPGDYTEDDIAGLEALAGGSCLAQ